MDKIGASRRQAVLGLSLAASLPVALSATGAKSSSGPTQDGRTLPPTAPTTQSSLTPAIVGQPRSERSLEIISPDRLAEESKTVLEPGAWAFIHGAAGSTWTYRANRQALDRLAIKPRRLSGFSEADTQSKFMGRTVRAPLYVCPMGAQDFAHVGAETVSARAAAAAGVPYMLTSASNLSLEEVANAVPQDAIRLFAIYLNTDPIVNRSLSRRARAAGYSALVMTIDSLGPGNSENFIAMGSPRTAVAGFGNFDPARGGVGRHQDLKRDFTPQDIIDLRQASNLDVIVKGVLRAEDAERCIAAGAAGIVVSNHGGRTLDGMIPAIDALPDVVKAVRGRVPIYFDSGVRRGQDIIRALALGADAVGIGRSMLDAVALGGVQGGTDLLHWYQKDLATQMLQAGVPNMASLTPDLLTLANYPVASE